MGHGKKIGHAQVQNENYSHFKHQLFTNREEFSHNFFGLELEQVSNKSLVVKFGKKVLLKFTLSLVLIKRGNLHAKLRTKSPPN